LLKKSFLNAGLFSYDFKSQNYNKGSGDNSIRGKGAIYQVEDHPFGLLPPPYYCGRQLRQKREDFTLPYDLWHLHSTDSLPARDIIASWNYKKIKSNIYSQDGKYMQSFETPACHCKLPASGDEAGCADKCLNRMTYTECDPESCTLRDRCSNMSIQRHASTTVLRRFMTPHKGWGVKTKQKIPKDTFIMEYLGEVVTDKEFKRRMHTDYQQDDHHYCMHVGEGMVIDGHRMGSECRFVNHSCKPNCEMQKWSVNGIYRMALFASRVILPDEELTYDYNFSLFNPHEGQTCHCGNKECRGVIGGKGRKNAVKTPVKVGKVKEKKAEGDGKKLGKVNVERSDENKSKTEELRSHFAPLKPMSGSQKTFCRMHSVLLLRNLEKIRRLRELFLSRGSALASRQQQQRPAERRRVEPTPTPLRQQPAPVLYSEEVFKAGLAALTTARSVTTRRLASAQDNPDISKVVQIARHFQRILRGLEELASADGKSMKSNFDNVPSKEDLPQYHVKIAEPIDFGIIEKSLSSGSYHSVAHIDQDILLLFQNNIRFYGCLSILGKQAGEVRARYMELCEAQRPELEEVVGPEGVRCLARPGLAKQTEEEDVISCPCGQFKDEGVMVQCDMCHSWQHTDCVAEGLDTGMLEEFTCRGCSGDTSVPSIPLVSPPPPDSCHPRPQVPQPEFASPEELYYVSLAREDGLQLTLGMTVYVLRAFKERPGMEPSQIFPRDADPMIFARRRGSCRGFR
jgi:histone-lysine N-methyltransferase ASH1L